MSQPIVSTEQVWPWSLEICIKRILNPLIKQNQKLGSDSVLQQCPGSEAQSPASRVQRPESSIESPAYKVQCPEYNIQSPAYRVQELWHAQIIVHSEMEQYSK